eukprot:scaffold4.g5045.t1
MLEGIRVVDRAAAKRLEKEERRQQRKDKKAKHKKEKRHQHKKERHRSGGSDSDSEGSSGSEGGGHLPRQRRQRDSDGSDSGPEDAWQQQQDEAEEGSGGSLAREDWMTRPMESGAARRQQREDEAAEEAAAARKAAAAAADQPGASARELNPYWKDGGEGLPPKEQQRRQERAGGVAAAPGGAVGDGGASWRLKALKRAQAQASAEGKPLGEIVGERWGSLGDLTGVLAGARAAPERAHLQAAYRRREADPEWEERQRERQRMREGAGAEGKEGRRDPERSRGSGRSARERAGYLEDVGTRKAQMLKPKASDSLSWRRPSRPSSRSESERGVESRPSARGEEVDKGRSGREARDARDSRPPRDPLGGAGDTLRAAAAAINTFANDGSFLEQVAARQVGGAVPADAKSPAGGGASESSEGGEARARALREPPSPSGRSSGRGGEAKERQQQQQQQEPHEWQQKPRERQQDEQRQQEGERRAAPRPPRPPPVGASGAARSSGGGDGGAVPQANNISAAAALRAKLMGRPMPEPAAQPPVAEEEGGPAAEDAAAEEERHGHHGRKHRRHEEVALPLVDAAGRAVPGAFGRESAGERLAEGRRGKRPMDRYAGTDRPGERQRYFEDDDADLSTLVKRTKHGEGGDLDAALARGIMRSQRFKDSDMDADAEYDHDAGLEMVEGGGKRGHHDTRDCASAREKQRQIADFRRMNSALEQCSHCFNSGNRPKQLTIAIGTAAYLALPARGRLVPGHCCIIPADHLPSSRQADETVWTEMRNFKKCLIQMFMKQGQDVVFIETAMHLGSHRTHAVVECIPDWSQHHAKRMIDTSAKGLRGTIPPSFPYLHVEYGISSGFVHVIDDESEFDRNLARNVMIGLLDLPQEDMHRRAKAESAAIQAKWAEEFRRQYEPFDWTRALG